MEQRFVSADDMLIKFYIGILGYVVLSEKNILDHPAR